MQIETNEIKALIDELDNWGWWAQEDDTRKLGYSAGPTSGGRTIAITDTRALELDRAIASLSKRAIKVIRYRFICNFSSYDIGRALNFNEESAGQLVGESIAKVSDYLAAKKAR